MPWCHDECSVQKLGDSDHIDHQISHSFNLVRVLTGIVLYNASIEYFEISKNDLKSLIALDSISIAPIFVSLQNGKTKAR